MVRGGRSGRGSTSSSAPSTSAGRGSTPIGPPPRLRQLSRRQWRYMFTREEDLPRARAVWESTAQTNFRKSLWEAQGKVMKFVGSQDPTAWMDYGPGWMWRDYRESLCHRWATRPWKERSQVAKYNRAAHPEKNVHTSASEAYGRTMVDRYAKGTP
ncbi:hypothetical protein Taro_052389 [Colocasia esculenta]|uniref:Uncharacterized protein n=1 Tax=Colocasia esculenta TaxID=4460 RepID=A0A843XJ84_COLES|nr:hypothetical protein [Colocasia esculenta]